VVCAARFGVRAALGGPAAALLIRSIEWKHGKAEAVLEGGAKVPAFKLEASGELESIQPGGGGAASAAEGAGPFAFAILSSGWKGGLQGVCAGLGGAQGESALRLCDDA
jgi:hypothetical protein